MAATESTFLRMCREFPVRTALFSFGPIALALFQLANGYLHGVPVLYVSGFAVLLVAFAVLVTRYHLVRFRLSQLLDSTGDQW